MKHADPADLAIYVHWPFCQSKCPYCDFNSHVQDRVDHSRWRAAFLAEIRTAGDRLAGRRITSVFFGGGTPSLMPGDLVGGLLEQLRSVWPFDDGIEITLEANPSSVEAARFAAYRDAGVNRISIGAQSLRDEDLRRLGRLHSAQEARRAIEVAQSVFARVSIDLIYARQWQDLPSWRDELRQALSFGTDHLSLYQLTIEPGTVFQRRQARSRLHGLPDEDRSADLYALTQDLCGAAGLPAYEVSNHALPGSEARHNLTYWRCGDYLGIGPGAHGRITAAGRRHAEEAPRDPAAWLERVGQSGTAITGTALAATEQGEEFLLMGLRLSEGIDPTRFAALSGSALPRNRVAALQDLGLLEFTGHRLRATAEGRLLLDRILVELLAQPARSAVP